MSLRNMPYLPLYVGDWLSNNSLKLCSAKAHGIMVNTMGLMHKAEVYGTILLKQKFKQTSKQENNFACQLAKLLPFDLLEIEGGLHELLEEKILIIKEDMLICERMVRDNEISTLRSKAGKKGGLKTQLKKGKNTDNFASHFAKAKVQANTEDENEDEYKDNSISNSKSNKSFKTYTEKEFVDEVKSFKVFEQYHQDFIDYWIEPSPSGKMKFQLNKTWSTKLRLGKWSRSTFNKPAVKQPTFSKVMIPGGGYTNE
jgi:hypothetical protein